MTFQDLIAKIGKGQKGSRDLTPEEAAFAAEALLSGKATPLQSGAFLVALRIKEETVGELVAFTETCRRSLHP
ncbi:MAG TPA: anthranilate phosphoribosyltransferase, partial [Nitrospiria bacterium]|nr:anthranilate phosphoribosyltransferase [Nitrospiria bacterium]